MKLNKIIDFFDSAIAFILLGIYDKSSRIPFFYKKVSIENYKSFLKRSTTHSWDEILSAPIIDGYIDTKRENFKITCDLNNHDNKFLMTLTQNKKELNFRISFEEKDNVIKYINIDTYGNYYHVGPNLVIAALVMYMCIYYKIHFLFFVSFLTLMRLYTIIMLNQSIALLKTQLAYMFVIYSINREANLF
jgi:hypothetical protein